MVWFVVTGIVGYVIKGLISCVVLLAGGWLFGIWIRRSLGVGSRSFMDFSSGLMQRADCSRRGLLEWVIEILRGSGFTVSKCQAITAAYDGE